MGTIECLGKFDLNTNKWYNPISLSDMLTSLSLVSYKPIIKNDSGFINYIIIIDGCRLENYSHSPYEISEKCGNILSILNYFKKRDFNIQVQLLLVDKDAPLKEESIILAKLIDDLVAIDNAKSVNIIGASKGGLIAFDSIKYLKNSENKMKTNIFAYSAPYLGTLLASPQSLKRELTKYIEAKLPKRFTSEFVINKLMNSYYKISSNSHMDYDISIRGGISQEESNKYDPSFLENIFSKENLNAINKVNVFHNICALATGKILRDSIIRFNFEDIFLCVLNKALFQGKGDGFVPLSSSSAINNKANVNNHLFYSTHRLIKKGENLNKLLSMVEKNMK